jgi:hypothetical protein
VVAAGVKLARQSPNGASSKRHDVVGRRVDDALDQHCQTDAIERALNTQRDADDDLWLN